MSPIKFSFKLMYFSLYEAKEYNEMDEIFDDMGFFPGNNPLIFLEGGGHPLINKRQ